MSLARAARESWVTWIILFPVYALTASLLIQPVLERLMGREVILLQIALGLIAFIGLSGIVSLISFPLFSFRVPLPARALYFRHELRSVRAWISALLAGAMMAHLPEGWRALSIWISLFPGLVALHSIREWRDFTILSERRADRFVLDSVYTRLFFVVVSWFSAWAFGAGTATLEWWFPSLVSAFVAASVLFEGDSGQPGAVHLIAIAAGGFAGLLTRISGGWAIAILYLCVQLLRRASLRLYSVETLDEDAFLS